MKRNSVTNLVDGDWDVTIHEPRWFAAGAVAAWAARRGLRWLLPRLVTGLALIAGAVFVTIQIAAALALSLVVFVAIPAAVFAFRCVTAAWNDVGGL
jgi:hypothetical protein